VKLCLSCHNPGSTDPETGNTVDMAVMIHKIHGGNYTTNTYEIVGFRQSYFDFSDTRFAGPTGEAKECGTCHTGATPLKFSRAACGACHDTVVWSTHMGGQADDTACNGCHSSTTAKPGVPFVHSKLYSSAAADRFTDPQFTVTITGVTGGTAGTNATIAFDVKAGGLPFDLNADLAQTVPAGATLVTNPRTIQSFRFSLAGPTTDFGLINNTTGNAPQSASTLTGTTFTQVAVGSYTYTFPTPIPAAAKGTYAIGFEGYYVQKLPATGPAVAAKSFAPVVPLAYFSVDGSTVAARRAIVDDAKCDSCHGGLGFHGESSRKTVAYCAFCHNAFNVNEERNSRPETFPGAATNTWTTTPWSIVPESVQMSTMIHRMHANLDLTAGQYVFGADRGVNASKPLADLTTFKFEFPNFKGVQNCAACHLPGTWGLPATTNLPTRVQTWTCSEDPAADADFYCTAPFYTATDAFVPPQAAMCTSCHDSSSTKAHAATMTFGGVEACDTCHGTGKDADVFKVHQPLP
jgi:OmcA/MtrC family decaheme c-type cytochrome